MPSTAIKRFSYDDRTRTLFVTFVDGDLYAYRGVEPDIYEAMTLALSKGRFFARRIRGGYAYAKLSEDGAGAVAFTAPDGTSLTAPR